MSVRSARHPRAVPARRPSRESGSAYLIALFMAVVLVISSQAAMKNLLTEGRRQREADTIWRGNQYVLAIQRYFRKTGHYPQNLDDLKNGLPELHFLRLAAYKDPMNKGDGSWRMIYVNASGQIICSTKYATLQQMALMDLNGGQMPTAQQGAMPGTPVSGVTSGTSDTTNQNAQGSQPGATTSGQGLTGGATGNPSGGAQTPGASQSDTSSQPGNPAAQLQPTGPCDGPVIGGFVTGVASSVDKPSIRVYKGGKKYIEWEFIWNPIEDQARAVQQGLSPLAPQPGQPGQPIAPGFGGTIMPSTSTTQPPAQSP
ncbi:MAG TPA: hypothetical protein VN822_06425 [Candidatus Acidoferrales bacterium]|nr:hypothetical protein [Candidatus Acidoferrales bacterium]